MDAKINKPNFMIGGIYFVEEFDLLQNIDFEKEFEDVEYETRWELNRGFIIPNGENDRLKFDIIPEAEFLECFFTGFLYKDNSILGKIKYIKDANEEDGLIKGQYLKVNNNRIIIRGVWDDGNGIKDFFWIELVIEKNDI
jgi:hypothetical protein